MDAFSLQQNELLKKKNNQPVNSLGEPVQGVIDNNQQQQYYIAPWATQEQAPQEESGYWDAAKRGAMAQAAGALGGQADFVTGVLGTDGAIGNALQGVMQNNNRKRNYTWDNIMSNPIGYALDPEGLAYDVGGGFGSSGVLGMEGLALATALPASVTGAVGAGIAGAAARVGLPWVGKIMSTPAGKALIGNVLKTPLEGMSEGGNVYREMTHDEYGNPIQNADKDAARKAMYTDAALNSALLTFTNSIESMGLGSLIAGVGGKSAFGRIMKGAIGDFLQNGYEEGAQQGINQYSQNKGTLGQIVNPLQWNDEQKTEALVGGITGLGQGAIMTGGGMAANKVFGNQQPNVIDQPTEQQQPYPIEEEPEQQQPKGLRQTPIADGIEDAGLQNTNPALRDGVDALNSWVYNNFGKDMIISGGARSEEHNREVNGSPTSHHLSGNAIDIDLSAFTEEERDAIIAQAKAMGFNSDGEDMFHDRGTGLHMHLILPSEGGLNYNGMDYTPQGENDALEGTENAQGDVVDNILDQMEQQQANPLENQEIVQAEQDNTQEEEETPQGDIVDRILDRMQGKQILPENSIPTIRRNGTRQNQGRTVNIQNPLTSAEIERILQGDRVEGGKKIKSMVSDLRNKRAAAKQKALDYEWMQMEHEKNMGRYTDADIRNNPSPNVREAAQNKEMQAITKRAMAGDHDAQRTFDRYNPDAKAFLLQREMDRLNEQNAREGINPQGAQTQQWLSDIYDSLDDKYGGNVFGEIKRRAAEKRKANGDDVQGATDNGATTPTEHKKVGDKVGKAVVTKAWNEFSRSEDLECGYRTYVVQQITNLDTQQPTEKFQVIRRDDMKNTKKGEHPSNYLQKWFDSWEDAENFVAKDSEDFVNENENEQPQGNNKNPQPEQGQTTQGETSKGEEDETTVTNGAENPTGETTEGAEEENHDKPNIDYEFKDVTTKEGKQVVEVHFKGKPEAWLRDQMKAVKMRWNPRAQAWWCDKKNADAMALLKKWGYSSEEETTTTTTTDNGAKQPQSSEVWGENPDSGLDEILGGKNKDSNGGKKGAESGTKSGSKGGQKGGKSNTADAEKAERKRKAAERLAAILKDKNKGNDAKINFNVKNSKAKFDADIFSVGCTLGYETISDYDNYEDWAEDMLQTITDAAGEESAEQLKPFLGMLYKGVSSLPKNFKLDETILSNLAPAVGYLYENGTTDYKGITNAIEERYGAENSILYADYIKAAFNGVEEFYKKTLDGIGPVEEPITEEPTGEQPTTGYNPPPIVQTTEEERQKEREKRKKEKAEKSSHGLALKTLTKLFEQSGIKVVTDLEELIDACRRNGMQVVNGEEATEQSMPLIVRQGVGMGELYGMMDPRTGTMYLDPNCDLDTPIHEYTHLWNKTIQATNPKLWEHGVELAKQSPLWTQIANDPFYRPAAIASGDFDKYIADEVLARICGPDGERTLQEMAIGESTPEGLVNKLKNWAKQFWQLLKKTFVNWGNDDVANMTEEEFAKMPMRALLDGVDVLKLRQDTEFGLYDPTKDDGLTKEEAQEEAEKNKPKGDDEDDSSDADGTTGADGGRGTTDDEDGQTNGKPRPDGADGEGSGTTQGRGRERAGSDGVPGSGSAVSGEEDVSQGENGDADGSTSTAGDTVDVAGDNPGFTGEPIVDEDGIEHTLGTVEEGQTNAEPEGLTEDEKEYRNSLNADEKGIFDKVVKKMPFLSLLQKGNIVAWIKRAVTGGSNSMLLTDGTGTGKTYSGLAAAKEVLSRKDARVLVVTPSQSICEQWIKAAQNQKHFDIQNSAILDNTKDAGKEFKGKKGGFYTTTYANFQANTALFEKDWDLVIMDEGHHLSSANNGSSTGYLKNLRALTFHNRGLEDRADILYATPEEKKAREEYTRVSNAAIGYYNTLTKLERKHEKYGDYPSTMDFMKHAVYVEEADAVMPSKDYVHGTGDDKAQDIQGFYSWVAEQVKNGKINSKQKQALINKYSPLYTGVENTWSKDGIVTSGILHEQIDKLFNIYEPLRQATKDIKEQHIEEWKKLETAKKPKVLFLSATPFAYHFNTDYAEGYLFDYPELDKAVDKAATPRIKFLHETFGYELDKKGFLSGKFEDDADVSQLEVDFHESLRASGALRGESLSIPADYNRGFIIAGSETQDGSDLRSEGKAVGTVIDEAFKALGDTEEVNGKEEAAFPDLQECILRSFGGDKMTDLLEALKAQEAVRYAREYVKQGKKVVIIHRRKKAESLSSPLVLPKAWKGGIFTQVPKDQKDALIQRIKDQYEKFLDKYPLYRPIEYVKSLPDPVAIGKSTTPSVPFKLYVIKKGKKNEQYICKFDKDKKTFAWEKQTEDYVTNNLGTMFDGIKTALATMQDEFKQGEALYFNGSGTDKEKAKVLEAFNNDDSKQDIFVGQIDACVEGLNLHDTTGKKPRVLINITIPTKPSEFVQVEGRIYRWGTATNAMFRYITTGTFLETKAWISRVAGKVATSENLAMGSRARGLLNSIREAFMETVESDTWKSHLPGADGEDVGGKALDYRAQNGSGYEMAKGDYARSEKYSAKQDKDGYYATPEPIGYKMVEWAGIKDGDKILEPSAGHGAISRYFPQKNTRVILETNPTLATVAQFYTPDSTFIDGTFENYSTNIKFDNIVMTPPVHGNVGVEHVVKAYHQLRNGGRIVAMINDTPEQRKMLDAWLSGKGQQYFGNNDWYKDKSNETAYIRQAIKMPSAIFERSTGKKVKPLVIILDRLDGKRQANQPTTLADITPIGDTYASKLPIDEIFDHYEKQFDDKIPARFTIDDSKAKERKRVVDWMQRKFAPLAEKYADWNYRKTTAKMLKSTEAFIGAIDEFSVDNKEYTGKAKEDPVANLMFFANNNISGEKVGVFYNKRVNGKEKGSFALYDGVATDESIDEAKTKLLVSAQNFLKRYYRGWLEREIKETETNRRKAVREKASKKATKEGKYISPRGPRVAVYEKDGKIYAEPLITVHDEDFVNYAINTAKNGAYGHYVDIKHIGKGVVEFTPNASYMADDVKKYVEETFAPSYDGWVRRDEEVDITNYASQKASADIDREYDKLPQYRFEPTGDAFADRVNEPKEEYFQKALKNYSDIANNELVQKKFHDAIMATMNYSPSNITLATEEVPKRRHEHPRLSKTLASSITKELVNEGTVSLVGRKIKNAQELAEYAQILRHPGYEKFHRIYVDKNGTIIDHDTVTSMMPDETKVYNKDQYGSTFDDQAKYEAKAKRPEVAKVFYIHNHPSTNVTPSNFDYHLTSYLAGKIQDKLGGHIILDTNMYTFIGPKSGAKGEKLVHDGELHTEQHRIPKDKQVNYFAKKSRSYSQIGKKIDGWAQAPTIAYWANKMDKEDGDIVAFLDSKYVCRAIVKLPKDVNTLSAPALNRYLRYLARKNYAATAIPMTFDPEMYQKYKTMVRFGSGLVDAMLMPGKYKDGYNSETYDRKMQSAYIDLGEIDRKRNFFGLESGITERRVNEATAVYDGMSFSNEGSLLGIEEAGGVKSWLKQQRRKIYTDWFDKNHALHDLDMAFSLGLGRELEENEKIYNKVQTLPASAAGMAQALVEGSDAHIHALNEKLGLKGEKALSLVTLKKVLNTINAQKMDKARPDFLAKFNKKNWVDAFSQYLGYERLLEMKHISEASGQEYKLPKGLTEKQMKQYIDAAPEEFKKAATQYYLVNANMLKLMENAGLISEETRKTLTTKYKKYCPLMRDFSDTAAADSFIGNLGNGGRGIGNVSSMLRRISIDGSDRTVLSPIESTVKAIAVCSNRCERNRVAQMAIKMVNDSDGALDEVIRPVPGDKSDPKNCVFTVMFNGKKQAYKTTQELYGPIVGYNIPAAGMVLGLAKSCATMLRTGATTSPSFVIRNVLRDTIFAGVSSQNGFIPLYDTFKGAYALWKDPKARAEFEAGGVTGFNFYNSKTSNYSDLLKMNGNKIDWHKPSAIWEGIKLLAGKSEDVSAFWESATRMGEFIKAREKGKSIDEAVRAARELTLDFSRSGVIGQNVNQYIPFFNAALQGGDKMVRLLKDDFVGTSTKLAEYIILPSLLLWCFNHDEDWYKELDPGIKNSCWCLPGGIRIPKPQEAGITFGSGLEAMLDQAFNKDPKAMSNWIKEVKSSATPNLIPTVFLPLIEWQANYSFFRGGPLVAKRLQGLPDEMQYTNHTATLSKGIGRVTGLSPVKIDNTVRGYTGTMGMFLWQAGDILEDKNEPQKKFSERQFIRDFNINDQHTMRFVNEFYELRDAANKQHAGNGKKGHPSADVQEIRKYGTIISGLNKDIQKITDSKTLSPARKRELIDNKKNRIKAVAKKAVEKYGAKYL